MKKQSIWESKGMNYPFEVQIKQKKFRNKETGEIVTQVPILEFSKYEEVEG